MLHHRLLCLSSQASCFQLWICCHWWPSPSSFWSDFLYFGVWLSSHIWWRWGAPCHPSLYPATSKKTRGLQEVSWPFSYHSYKNSLYFPFHLFSPQGFQRRSITAVTQRFQANCVQKISPWKNMTRSLFWGWDCFRRHLIISEQSCIWR